MLQLYGVEFKRKKNSNYRIQINKCANPLNTVLNLKFKIFENSKLLTGGSHLFIQFPENDKYCKSMTSNLPIREI